VFYLLCGITSVKPATETVTRELPSVRFDDGGFGVYWKLLAAFGGVSPDTV
jgi:hypothetical protein